MNLTKKKFVINKYMKKLLFNNSKNMIRFAKNVEFLEIYKIIYLNMKI
jgi:hypothetical protein